MNAEGKLALVTGAASGIGAEFARQLRQRGWRVVCVDRTPLPADSDAICLDLTTPDSTARLFAELDRRAMLPDLWINNAGIFDFKHVENLTPERLDLYIDLHIRSLTHLSREAARRMAARGSGRILNMSSLSCWTPMPGIAMYSATKAYIRVFSRSLRLEVADRGVSVTVACPGGLDTGLFGLPLRLRRLAVRLGVIQTPERFVRSAIARTLRGRKQYINGLLNRLAIVAVGCMPECARRLVKTRLLNRLDPLQPL